MSDLIDFANDVKKGSKELLSSIFGGVEPVTDLNKAADRNTLNVYTIISDSTPEAVRANIAKQIEAKIGSSIYVVMSSAVSEVSNIEDAASYFEMKFKGYGDSAKHTGSFHDRLIGSISESVLEGLDFNLTPISEAPKMTKKTIVGGKVVKVEDVVTGHTNHNPKNTKPSNPRSPNGKQKVPSISMNAVSSQTIANLGNKQRKDNFTSDGTVFNVTVSIKDTSYSFAYRVVSNIIVMPSAQILDAMHAARGSDNIYNYVKVRQGQASFFSDFLFNIKSIKRKASADFAKDINTRILNSITKNAGGYKTKFLADISEFKHYMLCITDSEVDQLKKQYNLDLTKPAGLTNVFENLLILELMVVNSTRSELAFYSSNDPHKHTLVDYSKLDSSNDAMRLFQSIMRNQ